MFKKAKSNTFFVEIKENNIKRLDIYTSKSGKKFQLFCDVKKSEGTIGVNNNFAMSILGSNGFTLIVDNRTLSLPEPKMSDNKDDTIVKIDEAFNVFKEFADQL